ncbi:MAG TPA: phosphoribosylamine--glycine ligase [Candidatus Limnocylindria bacterium]|nr:phosphoribosylamine--glycine ligase [Candidatus Limnocylindria bacterium]
MDVLVLGSGAREHALAWRLARDEGVRQVRIAPGNGGTPAAAETVADLDILDPSAVARHAARERYDLVVIGPEAPLAAGVADALVTASIPVFGPTRAAARLESSKAFAKEQMARAGVATARSATFVDVDAALDHVRTQDRLPVVKADWLAAGKGVVVPDTPEEAEAAVRSLLDGAARGSRLVLEERLSGREVSVFALVSGEAVVPLGSACDYKRLGDGDVGPNTGGMGAYSPVPWFGSRQVEESVAAVFEPIAWRLARDGMPYRGMLYAGLMLTENGPMVLEFNARFGDPESQVLLPLLDGQRAEALLGAATGDRGSMEGSVALASGSAVGVVIAAPGYPERPETDLAIEGADPAGPGDDGPLLCFHAATRAEGGGYVAAGGRVVTFVGLGADLTAARDTAYAGVAGCRLDGGQHRTDIGLREVAS